MTVPPSPGFGKKKDRVCSFPPVVDGRAKILILGTMPGLASLRANQYYAHPGNAFWKIIYGLFGQEPDPDYRRKIEFLRGKGIALWDVVQSCERPGSADSAIRREIPNDIEGLLKEFPAIRAIICNGRKAEALFRKHIGGANGLTCQCLPSTSPAHASKSYEDKRREWAGIKEALHER